MYNQQQSTDSQKEENSGSKSEKLGNLGETVDEIESDRIPLQNWIGSDCNSFYPIGSDRIGSAHVLAQSKTFSVIERGANGDGMTDNIAVRIIFLIIINLRIRSGKVFKDSNSLSKKGVLVAHTDEASNSVEYWVTFRYVNQLTINGGGSLDGQGSTVWPHAPGKFSVSLRFDFVNNSDIDHITSINSKKFHFNIFASNNIKIDNVHIVAPGDSPNTDGIHIANTSTMHISNLVIATGDDCVSMGPGSKNINISNVQCGPGHGISIGSLGGEHDEEAVSGIHVTNCNITNTMNGVRIKSWAKPFKEPLELDWTRMDKIDQIIIFNLILFNPGYRIWLLKLITQAHGSLHLSTCQSNPCQKIEMRDINIAYNGGGGPAKSACANAHGSTNGQQQPPACLVA
ncbi:hypothetical protein Ddye_011761 [Dipteronia dyeriana]|uniref:Uncharacterized protein n=1 Tax=Dipteronia dyeriana TaxID=168575 RepID=A0AAD9X370_9ROSI|nr:hypothetical protein Ddye_011761 [Dipteronia dyeriana]